MGFGIADVDFFNLNAEQIFNSLTNFDLVGLFRHFEGVFAFVFHRGYGLFCDNRTDQYISVGLSLSEGLLYFFYSLFSHEHLVLR